MRTRALTLVALMLLMLAASPQFEAMPTGIGAAGDNGCSCHGGPSGDTSVVVEGLPDTFNASETYAFTVTVVNDVMELHNGGSTEGADPWNGHAGGFRILTSSGMVSTVNESLSHDMDGGLTHTAEANGVRSWDFEFVAPGDDGKVVEITVYGNAVNGGAGSGGDYWNEANFVIPGANAGDIAPSARALVVLVTAIGLALGLVLLGVMYVFYARSPNTFTIENFWSYLKPWLTTTDHKEVGILYFLYGFIFFLVGGILALLFRIQLALPENTFLTETEYNSFFTLHGTTMIFLAAMPMIAGFMNYVLPLQIGAKDLAFPRINAMGLWLLVFSSPLIYAGIWSGEGADITWVMYPPYSSLTEANLGAELAQYGSNPGTTAFIAGILMLGASSTLGGVNFITTVFTMRAPGVGFMKMPLFAWSVFVSVFMLYMSLPAFIIGVAFLLFDHTLGTVFFTAGGDSLLFQHLFWFFGHPEVYVVVVPAFGIVSEVLATSARRSIFGYKSMVFAMAGIGVVGFIVWGHHMLTSGMDPFWRAAFMITTMAVAIPTGAKVFNWLATIWGGSMVMRTHTLWSLGFLVTFTLGGISGMFFPVAGLDVHFHDSYFVVAHFHYVFIGGTVFALFSGVYYWYPKATGRKLNETLGLWHFLIGFASYNATFWPMHALGIMGMPRRTHSYTTESGFAEYNMAVSTFSFIFGLSQLLLVWNIIRSNRHGEPAGNDPWGGWSLEWMTTSPPPTPSFHDIPTQGDMNELYGHHGVSEKKVSPLKKLATPLAKGVEE
jgi:cytochrome c oxidase subunit 1